MELNDLEICLNALYGYMLMNIRHEVISENTRLAMKQFSAPGLDYCQTSFEGSRPDISNCRSATEGNKLRSSPTGMRQTWRVPNHL
jgi:hypothetical protein